MEEKKQIKILMVDDHPSMLDGYKLILYYNYLGLEIETTTAHNCENAYEIISHPLKKNYFDLAFLDYSLPIFAEKNINNGEDLGLILRSHSPDTKIAILTSHTEVLLLYQIIKNLDPNAFEMILEGETYYSATVKQVLRELLLPEKFLGKLNRQILALIGEGVKTKNLPEHLNLTLSAIQKRKTQIRIYLNLEKGTDDEIIKEAKKRGLI